MSIVCVQSDTLMSVNRNTIFFQSVCEDQNTDEQNINEVYNMCVF